MGSTVIGTRYIQLMDEVKDLRRELTDTMKQAGAWDVGFARPGTGFDHVLPGYHPSKVWPDCRTVIVFAVPMSPEMNDTYLGPYAPWEGRNLPFPVPGNILSEEYALCRMVRLTCNYVRMLCMTVLESKGFHSTFSRIQFKPAAYEAGLGIYGRSGIIIHPELGSRLALGVVMTDAEIPADSPIEDFDPCRDCGVCISNCPAGAYDPGLAYPESWSRDTCMARRAEIDSEGLYCNNCMTACPAGTIPDDVLLRITRAVNIWNDLSDPEHGSDGKDIREQHV
jgi:epoxyqueuosine reductase QueG